MNHKDQLDAIARDWANGYLALYDALYAAYDMGKEDGFHDGFQEGVAECDHRG